MKTFLIDDDAICNYLTETILSVEGLSTDIRSFLSAEEALDLIERDFPEHVPDLILLDLNMPLMSGWEFLDALSQHELQLKGKCRIYILTSSIDLGDIEKSKAYGLVTGYIQKPMDNDAVRSVAAEIRSEN